MLIKYQALPSLLQKKTHALYVLIGNEPYLLNDAAVQIKQLCLKRTECEQTTLDIYSPADWSLLIAEANNYSLFSEHVLLDARYDKKTIDAAGKTALTDYIKDVNDRCMIILRAPLLSAKALQWLVDSPNVVVIQLYPLPPHALMQWIGAQLLSRGMRVELAVPNLIHEYTQGNMLATAQLLDKLSLCCAPEEIVTASLVKEHLIDQSHFELFELAAACLGADALKALRLLQQSRLDRTEPTLVLWILTQEIRLLIQLHDLLNQSFSIDNACSQLKIWSSRIQLYTRAISRLTLEPLYQLLHECKQLDEMIKTTQSNQIWNKFDRVALALCGSLEKN